MKNEKEVFILKRFACVLLVLVFLPIVSLADLPDLSGLSYDELVQLRDQINIAIWNSAEWQEVSVPPGLWKIGDDIPAGHWTIRPGINHGYFYVWYFEKPNEFNKPFATLTKHTSQALATEDFHAFDEEYIHSIDFDMQEGWYFYSEHTVIFTPYSGKPELGFK